MPSTAIQTAEPNKLAVLARDIDAKASGAMELFTQAGSFEKEIALAQTMGDLRQLLTPEIMQPVMALMNTSLGFRTDRDPKQFDKNGQPNKPYAVEVVRDVLIEAKLRGFHTVGNEFNIIAGQFYACKNGLRRKVTKFPGLTEFRDLYDVPRIVGDKGALVKCRATWKKDGQADSLETEFAVKVNAMMGSDAITGKAERKLLKRVLDRITGMNTPEGDVDDPIEVPGVKVSTEAPTFSKANPEPAATTATTQPAAATAPADPTKQKLARDQDELARIVVQEGFKFDDWKSWAVDSGQVEQAAADNINGFDEVPDAIAKLCLRAKAGMFMGLSALRSEQGS